MTFLFATYKRAERLPLFHQKLAYLRLRQVSAYAQDATRAVCSRAGTHTTYNLRDDAFPTLRAHGSMAEKKDLTTADVRKQKRSTIAQKVKLFHSNEWQRHKVAFFFF